MSASRQRSLALLGMMTTQANSDVVEALLPCLSGRVCIVGVGNRMKGDDAAGPLLIDRVAGKIPAECVDAGVAPENYVEKIARLKPETAILVDAMDFDGAPGDIRVFAPGDVSSGALSTHALSLQMTCEYLQARGVKRVALIGIQPRTLDLGADVSRAVRSAVERLAEVIRGVLQETR